MCIVAHERKLSLPPSNKRREILMKPSLVMSRVASARAKRDPGTIGKRVEMQPPSRTAARTSCAKFFDVNSQRKKKRGVLHSIVAVCGFPLEILRVRFCSACPGRVASPSTTNNARLGQKKRNPIVAIVANKTFVTNLGGSVLDCMDADF